MSRRCYSRRGCGGLSAALDDTAHIASSFGPVGALWTGAIGFACFHIVLPLCMMAWTAERTRAGRPLPSAKLSDRPLWVG